MEKRERRPDAHVAQAGGPAGARDHVERNRGGAVQTAVTGGAGCVVPETPCSPWVLGLPGKEVVSETTRGGVRNGGMQSSVPGARSGMARSLVGVIGGEQQRAGREERRGGAEGGGGVRMRGGGVARSGGGPARSVGGAAGSIGGAAESGGGEASAGVVDSEVNAGTCTMADAVVETGTAARTSNVRQAGGLVMDRAAEEVVRYKKDLTVVAEVVEGDRLRTLELMRAVQTLCGGIVAFRETGLNKYEITVKSEAGKHRLLDGLKVGSSVVMVRDLAVDELVVSFLNLPAYIPDEDILTKLSVWGVRAISPIKRRFWPGTTIADGTRYVKVKFNESVQLLPYSARFLTATGPEYFRVLHNNQVKVCRLCLQPGHVLRDCPEFTCFNCNGQGHYARECDALLKRCAECHSAVDGCVCMVVARGVEGRWEDFPPPAVDVCGGEVEGRMGSEGGGQVAGAQAGGGGGQEGPAAAADLGGSIDMVQVGEDGSLAVLAVDERGGMVEGEEGSLFSGGSDEPFGGSAGRGGGGGEQDEMSGSDTGRQFPVVQELRLKGKGMKRKVSSGAKKRYGRLGVKK